jgi:hypothetical protein
LFNKFLLNLFNKFNKFNRKNDTLNRPASESYLQSTLVIVSGCRVKMSGIVWMTKQNGQENSLNCSILT